MNEPIEVNVGECLCPAGPEGPLHPAGDLVYLRPKPDLMMALAAQAALNQAGNYPGDNEAAVYSVFVRYGVIAWNIRDAKGPVPVTHDSILDRLEWLTGGKVVAHKGRALYHDEIFGPLAPAKSAPPRPSRKTGSTSANRPSGRRSPNSPSQPSPSPAVAGT